MVILLSETTVFICHPLKCSLVFPKDLSLGSTYLFITVLCNSIKHSKYFLSADTTKIAHSTSSATDSIFPLSDIDSIHSQCAADLILTKLKSAVQFWLHIILINQNIGSHMYFDLLYVYYWLFLIVILHPSQS